QAPAALSQDLHAARRQYHRVPPGRGLRAAVRESVAWPVLRRQRRDGETAVAQALPQLRRGVAGDREGHRLSGLHAAVSLQPFPPLTEGFRRRDPLPLEATRNPLPSGQGPLAVQDGRGRVLAFARQRRPLLRLLGSSPLRTRRSTTCSPPPA